jgi:hypothetical protein
MHLFTCITKGSDHQGIRPSLSRSRQPVVSAFARCGPAIGESQRQGVVLATLLALTRFEARS